MSEDQNLKQIVYDLSSSLSDPDYLITLDDVNACLDRICELEEENSRLRKRLAEAEEDATSWRDIANRKAEDLDGMWAFEG